MAAERTDAEYRNIKRIRQACSSCRRKKVRCSGERPTCAFCRRLDQPCSYSDESATRPSQPPMSLDPSPDQLASRVASLESQLQQLQQLTEAASRSNNDRPTQSQDRSALNGRTPSQRHASVQSSASFTHFLDLPPAVMQTLIDAFFLHFHNQPYSLFHETSFRQRMAAGLVPQYLTFSFLAWALRFSHDPFFQHHQIDIARYYATESWRLIEQQWHETDEETDLHLVQALLLQSLFDLAESRRRRSWIKTGITIRLAQDLRLMVEPGFHLNPIDKEERRRVFWSIYLLDKLMACGRMRPAAISDNDCHVQLPSDEFAFRQGIAIETSNLPAISYGTNQSPFALVILMASTLARCSKHVFDQSAEQVQSAGLIPTSDMATIDSALSFFHLNFDLTDSWERTIAKDYMADGIVDQQRAGHFVLSHALFHLCHCLLSHPFLLFRRAEIANAKTPFNVIIRSLSICRAHAVSLSVLLRDIQNISCIAWTSLYGYIAVVSGTVHMLYTHSDDQVVAEESADLVNSTISFLQKLSVYWPQAEVMATSLHSFQAESARYQNLLCSPFRAHDTVDKSDFDRLAELLDYSMVSTRHFSSNMQYPDGADSTSRGVGSMGRESMLQAGSKTDNPPFADYDRRHQYNEGSSLLQSSQISPNQNHHASNANRQSRHQSRSSTAISPHVPSSNPAATDSRSLNSSNAAGPIGDSMGVDIDMIGGQRQRNLSLLSQFLMKESMQNPPNLPSERAGA